MNFVKPIRASEIFATPETETERNIRDLAENSAALRQNENGQAEATANSLSSLLRRVSGTSTREIDTLIGDLQGLRDKLFTDGDRIQRDIVEYAALSQQVMQLTRIISESVKRLPDSPSTSLQPMA